MSFGAAAAEIGEYFTSGDLRYMIESLDPPVALLVAPENAFSYSGDITIPATVANSGTTYTVTVGDNNGLRHDVTSLTFDPEYSGQMNIRLDYALQLKKTPSRKKPILPPPTSDLTLIVPSPTSPSTTRATTSS